MQLFAVQAHTNNLSAQRDYYHRQLGLPIVSETDDLCRLQIGASTLTWLASDVPLAGAYHFAFTIPENQLAAGVDWVQQRSAILAKDGQTRFHFAQWNADATYFRDADGNILEIIARHNLANATTAAFGPASLLNLSEVGLPSGDVLGLADRLTSTLGIPDWLGRDAQFTTMGDEAGLLILVPMGRSWLPTTQPALPLPLTLHALTGTAGEGHWPDLPYHVFTE
ncbi:MAG: hypothetical protein H0X24_16450 [Ktedonobacterales bacterium]|nr:hypothetical protein [Ktedonobacterales bacterium]